MELQVEASIQQDAILRDIPEAWEAFTPIEVMAVYARCASIARTQEIG